MKYPSNTNNALAIDTLMNLFTELYLNSINTEEYDDAYGYPKWFVRLVSYIDENYRSSLTIEDFTAVSSLSASHLHKLFKEYTGTSPYNYLLDVRINSPRTCC
jgi:AraC-like DNA-binding protein